MKWLSLFKKKRKGDDADGDGGCEWGARSPKAGHAAKRRSMQERKERTSIEQWHEARKSRTSIDICCSGGAVTTTEKLSVCKAGMTTLINRTYIVIKHLGSGTSGQVKLAFNLRSKKLVAIKAVLKSASGGASALSSAGSSAAVHPMSCDGGAGPLAHYAGGSLMLGRPSSLARGWRSLTGAGLRRSNSSSATSGSLPTWAAQHGLDNAAVAAADARRLAKAEEFVREIAILKRLSHPNVVQLLEVIDDPASDNLLIVMGYVEGSTLQPEQLEPNRWKPVPEDTVWRQARDVLSGLDYLHSHGVVHGDLKPANLIQDSLTGVIKILDFGSAVLHSRPDALRGAHGPTGCTPAFRSPESLESGYRPSFELDMWALGVCLYLWVIGELPFKGSAPFVVYDAIRNHPLQLPAHPRISNQLADLLSKLLDKNPQTRLTVRQAMQHPWTSAQNLAPLRPMRPVRAPATREQSVALSAPPPAAASAQAVATPSPPPPLPADEGPSSNMAVDEQLPWCQSSTQPLVPGTAMLPDRAAAAAAVVAVGGSSSCIRWADPQQQRRRLRRTRSMIDSDQSSSDQSSEDDEDEEEDQLGRGAPHTDSDDTAGNFVGDDTRWELRRSVTDEELEAAISSCFSATGSAAVLMESIFTEVTFSKGHQIIRAGDNLEQIYLIVAGEVELYHDLLADGPDAQLPDRPLIQGLEDEDPEATLADPGDFLDIRLPGIHKTTLDRLPTSLLTASAPGAAGSGPGGTGSGDGPRQLQPPPQHLSSFFAPGSSAGGSLGSIGAGGATGGPGGSIGCAWHGTAGSRGGTSSQFLSSSAQAGMLVVATKGPGDSLGFAGLGSSSGSSGGAAAAADADAAKPLHRPVWLANVRAKTQVTAFAASIASLHKLARTHPQVEPLLRQIAWQQETDMAVAEAMRCLRLAGNNASRSRSPSVAVTGAGTSTTNTTFTTGTLNTAATPATTATGSGGNATAAEQEGLADCTAATAEGAAAAARGAFGLVGQSGSSVPAAVVVPWGSH